MCQEWHMMSTTEPRVSNMCPEYPKNGTAGSKTMHIVSQIVLMVPKSVDMVPREPQC